MAARAGVDSIEHATYANDETLKLIRDHGLTLVPGLRHLYSIIENGPRFGITEDVIGPSGLRDEIKQAADTYRRAKDLGIRTSLTRMQERIGTRQPGKLADIVIVDRDPLRDISILQDRARLTVTKGGAFV